MASIEPSTGQVFLHNHDSRYINSGESAGGDLTGTYPNPSVAFTNDTLHVLRAGDTMTGALLFTDNAIDIGASGATRPRTIYVGTSMINPLLIGGTLTTSDLTLQTTSGIGATGADMHFLVGNNGATEAMTILNSGNVGIGTTNPGAKLHAASAQGSAAAGSFQFDSAILSSDWTNTGTALEIANTNQTNNNVAFVNFVDTVSGAGHAGFGAVNTNHANDYGDFFLFTKGTDGYQRRVYIQSTGNVGIGTTSPTNLLSLGGNSARIFWLERHTTANTAGNTLTITAGGATSGATDKNGGDLLLQGGLSTGTGESGVQLYGCVAGATGTADRTQTLGIRLLGNKLGVFSTTPVVQQNTIVDADGTLADITTKFNTLLASLEAYGWLKSV